MLDLFKRLLDPKTQLLIVGVLGVIAGVLEYLLGNEFIKGYPEIVGALSAASVAITALLRVARTLFLGGATRVRKMCKKG